MFIGMIAYTYRFGLESVWIMFGWVLRDLVAWLYVHPRVRRASGEARVNTLPLLIGIQGNSLWHFPDKTRMCLKFFPVLERYFWFILYR